MEEAHNKSVQLKARKEKLLLLLKEQEQEAVEEDRALFLYLKGRLLNISGDFSQEAEVHLLLLAPGSYISLLRLLLHEQVVLSKAVKLRPDLVEAWNELGESYMMKQVIETAGAEGE